MGIPLYGQNKDGDNLEALANALSGSKAWDAGNIADGDEEALEITVVGAALGDFVLSSLSIDVADLALSGAVTAADTVTLVLSNNTGGAVNLGAATAYCMVVKKP